MSLFLDWELRALLRIDHCIQLLREERARCSGHLPTTKDGGGSGSKGLSNGGIRCAFRYAPPLVLLPENMWLRCLDVVKSSYSRPWRHVAALKTIDSQAAMADYFHRHKHIPTSLDSSTPPANTEEAPLDWDFELLSPSPPSHPLLLLPALLRFIGPSFITIFKHILGRRRVLFYTNAPVETAAVLARCCVDVAFGDVDPEGISAIHRKRDDRRPAVLGTVGLVDLDKLKTASQTGLGWVACEPALLA